MKYGTYFAYWEKEWAADYIHYCQKASSLGFDVLEVSAAGLIGMSDSELELLKQTARKEHITLTACIGFPKEYDTSSVSPSTRERGIAFAKKVLDATSKAGIDRIGGIMYSYWPVAFSRETDMKLSREHSIQSTQIIADYAANLGITLMLETVNRYEHYLFNRASEALAFVKEVSRDNVKVMLDTYHMNIEEDSIGDAIRQTGKYLGHLHIGECNRKVPGKGHMPWKEIGQALRDIKYDGYVVMEPFVRTGGTIGFEIKVWHDLSEHADEPKLDRDIQDSLNFVRQIFGA